MREKRLPHNNYKINYKTTFIRKLQLNMGVISNIVSCTLLFSKIAGLSIRDITQIEIFYHKSQHKDTEILKSLTLIYNACFQMKSFVSHKLHCINLKIFIR